MNNICKRCIANKICKHLNPGNDCFDIMMGVELLQRVDRESEKMPGTDYVISEDLVNGVRSFLNNICSYNM